MKIKCENPDCGRINDPAGPYCSNCGWPMPQIEEKRVIKCPLGHDNDPSAMFCETCGKPISQFHPPSRTKRSWLSRMASIGAFIVVVFFFLPWVSVSCSIKTFGAPAISASGYQIASGKYSFIENMNSLQSYLGEYATGMDMSELTGLMDQTSSPLVWLILVFGALGIASLLGGKKGGALALSMGILGIILLIIFGIRLSGIDSQIGISGFRLKTEGGLIAEWLGFLIMAGVGVVSLIYDDA